MSAWHRLCGQTTLMRGEVEWTNSTSARTGARAEQQPAVSRQVDGADAFAVATAFMRVAITAIADWE